MKTIQVNVQWNREEEDGGFKWKLKLVLIEPVRKYIIKNKLKKFVHRDSVWKIVLTIKGPFLMTFLSLFVANQLSACMNIENWSIPFGSSLFIWKARCHLIRQWPFEYWPQNFENKYLSQFLDHPDILYIYDHVFSHINVTTFVSFVWFLIRVWYIFAYVKLSLLETT